MKFINTLTLLLAALFFAGCASTEEKAPMKADSATGTAPAAQATDDTQVKTSGLLMDRYKSGEIPGYRDEHKPMVDAN